VARKGRGDKQSILAPTQFHMPRHARVARILLTCLILMSSLSAMACNVMPCSRIKMAAARRSSARQNGIRS